MVSRLELKTRAKSQLKNNWILAIITFVCYSLILQLVNVEFTKSVEASNFGIALNILGILLYGPVQIGICRFSLNLSKGDSSAKFKDLFSGFDVFLKSLLMNLIIMICISIGMILFIIPGIILIFMFSQANYILAENPEKSSIECLKESIRMMKGYKFEYFVLYLSFVGWFILSILTFGIGFLWLVPYYQITATNFYLELKNN